MTRTGRVPGAVARGGARGSDFTAPIAGGIRIPGRARRQRSRQRRPGRLGWLRAVLAMEDMEAVAIRRALSATSGNVSRAAQVLRISRATLYGKTKKFGIRIR